ncbi:GCN5-related N-acetyltransferase [Stanieria cyanosphaera PCC 7437]|uniref:GCN5-related N-acetyltransferase n=1 Tax=Stanieria cyanosphaera (strain ATCC 29371 / PCC 7437) TaxID=111780 RepID=K9XRB2_STAC7|nr:GNAT family N-acetyltransferase [Stanieria cyanosphaera]AFZ35155.1 GCN5-related N-acetyltransferase [Stanieria cyanosphaera PCC 7437]
MNFIEIKIVDYQKKMQEIKTIRTQVFQVEQGVAEELEFDGLDEKSQHLIAYLNQQPVGTTRIRTIDEQTVKIERLAVLSEARGQGIGKKLMEKALEIVSNDNYQAVIIHAQEYIKELYLKLGFEQVGKTFQEAGIAHIKMIKKL